MYIYIYKVFGTICIYILYLFRCVTILLNLPIVSLFLYIFVCIYIHTYIYIYIYAHVIHVVHVVHVMSFTVLLSFGKDSHARATGRSWQWRERASVAMISGSLSEVFWESFGKCSGSCSEVFRERERYIYI